ncbi:MAG: hypothetical protein JRI23_11975 [Deltaproteobacteria bacterium]|jgi:hypothetical protein|nr:hypothetical protein [Deltaproteobacteria bacterium]MBW2532426.1 hypothetical protein [Deltaproteobacteria bacterium]
MLFKSNPSCSVRQRWSRATWLMAALSLWAGCTLMTEGNLSDKPTEGEAGGAAAAAPTGTGTGAGVGGQGAAATGTVGGAGGTAGGGGQGGGECTSPVDCPGEDTTCAYRTCEGRICGLEDASADTSCSDDGGQVCDGTGSCVECNDTDDCSGVEVCDQHLCVTPHCVDGSLSGNETDVDCGGDCAPCANGDDCLVPDDCVSRFCASSGGAGGAGGTTGGGGEATGGGGGATGGGGGGTSYGLCSACATHTDCGGTANTHCASGICEDDKTDGTSCADGDECLSAHCVDLVCCAEASCDACEACDETGSEGTCTVVAQGELGDPTCHPYLCDGTSGVCPTSCSSSTDCAAGGYCDATSACVALKVDGTACAGGNECQSGNCADDVCCDTPCTGTCVACDGLLTAGTDGVCDFIAAGTDPDTECSTNQFCDGQGACASKADGLPCGSALECSSGFCVDGVCCASLCDAACYSCSTALTGGTDGTCDTTSAGLDPDDDCLDALTCDGAGQCAGPLGSPCANDAECSSGHCVDDVCCDTACDQTCEACTAALTGGTDGTCANALVGTDPHGDCAPNQSCSALGVCRLSNGEACTNDNQCATDFCPKDDDVCCDAACDGICEGCLAVHTGLADGQCGPTSEGTDPDADCVSNERCDGSGACICDWQPPPPGGGCPAACSSCSGNTCNITCSSDQSCMGPVNCPSGFDCVVTCSGDQACKNATINCPDMYGCAVSCACGGGNTQCCQGATINCSTTGRCSVGCNNALQACQDTTVECGDNSCDATCHVNTTDLPTVNCNNSCSCGWCT